jgi:hypothetical protein
MESEKNNKNKKKSELADLLVVGDFVDVYSNYDKKWRLALIVRASEDELEIAYDGSTSK